MELEFALLVLPLEGGSDNPVYVADEPPAEGKLPPVRRYKSITPGQHHSGPSWRLPEPPPIWRSLRKVTASIRVIFIGSAAFTAACIAEGRALIPAAASDPAPNCFRNTLRFVTFVCTV